MKKLITNLALFIIPLLVIYFVVIFFPTNKKNTEYTSAIIDKINHISFHKSASTIIVGGSNVVFGIDSKVIKDTFDCDVINLGLQASLGIIYQLDLCKKYAKSGDIILLIPEYYQYMNDDYYGTGSTLAKVIELSNPYQIFGMQYRLVRNSLPYLFPESIHKISTYYKTIGGNERGSFNEYGDFIGHLKLKNRPKSIYNGKYDLNGKLKSSTFKILSDYFLYFKSKNIYLYITFPSFPKSLSVLEKDKINAINKLISKYKIPQIGLPENAIFSDSLFFEYPNHLNVTGRAIRTKNLIQLLKGAKIVEHFSNLKLN
jgi:hypothetical protein